MAPVCEALKQENRQMPVFLESGVLQSIHRISAVTLLGLARWAMGWAATATVAANIDADAGQAQATA